MDTLSTPNEPLQQVTEINSNKTTDLPVNPLPQKEIAASQPKLGIIILILILFTIGGIGVVYLSTRNLEINKKEALTTPAPTSRVDISMTPTVTSNLILTHTDLQKLDETIQWQTEQISTRQLYNENGTLGPTVSGYEVYSQDNMLNKSFSELLIQYLEDKGWVQNTGADGPGTSIVGLINQKDPTKAQYIELTLSSDCFSFPNCKEGLTLFVSQEFTTAL